MRDSVPSGWAVARLRAPGLVVEHANDEMIRAACRPLLARPLAEAFPEPRFAAILGMMELVEAFGSVMRMTVVAADGRPGLLTVRRHETDPGLLVAIFRPARSGGRAAALDAAVASALPGP